MSKFLRFRQLALLLTLLVLLAACRDPVDPRPNAFSFDAITDAELSTDYTSNEATLSGFAGQLAASATGGTLIVNGSATTGSTPVSSGDKVAVRVSSSSEYSTTVSATVTVGAVSSTFTVATIDEPVPLAITSFGTEDDLLPSTTITLSWTATGTYDGASLVGAVSGLVDAGAIDVANGTAQVTLPTGVPEETYTLVLTNSETGEEDDADLVTQFELWICEAGSGYNIADYIPDANLLAALRAALGAPFGNISCNNMRSLLVFNWSYPTYMDEDAFSSLVGLQHAANLHTLLIAENEVSDLTPLSVMPSLQILDLDRNHIHDLTPLTGMTNITEIGLWDNGPVHDHSEDGIQDITALGTLVNLETLYLSNNWVEDLGPLANLPNLRVLYALNNRLTSIEPLRDLNNLVTVRLGFQEIPPQFEFSDITPLAGKPNLARVELQFVDGLTNASLAVLEPLTSLYMVDLRGDRNITDLTPLVGSVLPENTLSDAIHGVNAERDSDGGPYVYVCNNHSFDAASPGVADLEADGVNVGYEGSAFCPLIDPAGMSMGELMRLMLGDDIR